MKGKNSRSFLDKIITWLNIVLSFALLISYLAPVVDPQKAWPIAFFGLAFPFLLLGNLVMLVYWLFRRSAYVLLPVLIILAGWDVIKNNIGLRQAEGDPVLKSGKVIRMMTYNVHNFKRYGSNNDISTKREILRIINEQQPDIIGFQEFYTRKHGQYDTRDSILKILGFDNYYFQPIIFNKDEAIGVAIFSKFPIITQGLIPLSDKLSENACIYIDVKKGSQQFRVYSVHLQSIRFDPEDYRYLKSISHQGPDMTSAGRLGMKLKNAFIKRSRQVSRIKQLAASCPYPYIISGDFNDTPTSFAVNQMSKGLKNAFREKGYGLGRTYNGAFPNYQIDYIMASAKFEIVNYRIIEKKLSDHYPVRSDLILH